MPDLKRTPNTIIEHPRGLQEVKKGLHSEEGLINSTDKMRQLTTLRDHVFRSREERFHWDPNRSPEFATGKANEDADYDEVQDVEAPDFDSPQPDVFIDYEYRRNTFIAVRPSLGEVKADKCKSLFWIGNVSSTEENSDGIVSRVKVHWYELSRSTDIFLASIVLHFCIIVGIRGGSHGRIFSRAMQLCCLSKL